MITETVSNLYKHMEAQNDTEVEEMDNNNLRTDLSSAQQLEDGEINELSKLFKIGYGELWQGDHNFRSVIMRNATQVLRIYSEDNLAAGLVLDNSRITVIAVNPDFQAQGLGVKLFAEASKACPDVWITVGMDIKSEAMIATLTSRRLNFMPVEDKSKIEHLFQQTNQGRDHYRVEVEDREVPFLSQRLALKGVKQDTFGAYTRSGATHNTAYQQILFQNQP